MDVKLLLLLALIPLAACQSRSFGSVRRGFFSRPRGATLVGTRRGFSSRPQGSPLVNSRRGTSSHPRRDAPVDARRDGSEYHYSWRHDGGRKYTGQDAQLYCQRLGAGWQAVSLETRAESQWLNGVVIAGQRKQYVWTSGIRQCGSSWRWATGGSVAPLNWSPSGGFRRPQPDNREGNENCLAVLNNFYGDGIRWHDVGCSHRKPVVCERRA